MEHPKPIEILDAILEYLRINNDKEQKDSLDGSRITMADIMNHLQNRFNYALSHQEIIRPLKKLQNDGFIEDGYHDFYITYDGYLFHGYEAQAKYDKSINRNNQIRSFALAWGTALAGIYGLFEILKWAFHHFHWVLLV